MMKLSQKQKLAVAIVMFIISGYVLYSTFFKSPSVSSPQEGSISSDMLLSTTTTENQDIVDLANKFNEITINVELFASPLFLSLKDLGVPLSSEVSGRPNPFAIIGNDSGSFTTTSFSPVSTTKVKKVQ